MKAVFSPTLICAGLLLGSLSGFADTVTLKSGETLNGTVLSENDQEIVFDVKVAAGISDEKKIAKSDVVSVTKTTEDQAAYEPLKNLAVGPRSLAAAGYDPIIKSLEDFLAKHPQSAHAAEVKTKLDAFKQDQAQVKAGSLKWDNRWYKPAEIEKNKAFLGSEMLLATMKDQAARYDYIGALNNFAVFEKNYPKERAYLDAVELAQSQLRVAASEMERIRAIANTQEEQFNKGIQLVGEPEKSQMIAARKAQVAAAEATFAAAEKSQVKWKPLLPLAKKSFETLKSTLASEGVRIDKIPAADMRKSIEDTKAAEVAIKSKNAVEAEAKLKEAQALWKENPQIAALNNQLKPLKEELKRHNPAPAAASGTSSDADATTSDAAATSGTSGAPTPTPTPSPKDKKWYEIFF